MTLNAFSSNSALVIGCSATGLRFSSSFSAVRLHTWEIGILKDFFFNVDLYPSSDLHSFRGYLTISD